MKHSRGPNIRSIASTILVIAIATALFLLDRSRDTDSVPASDSTANATSTARADLEPGSSGNREAGEQPQTGLRPAGRDFVSAGGLVYSPGSREGHRRDHVLRHARDDPTKRIHGVFDNEETVFDLVDQAYEKVKSRSSDATSRREGHRTIHTVRMHRRIGYKGGQIGQDEGHPPLDRIRLILEEEHVITAYPY